MIAGIRNPEKIVLASCRHWKKHNFFIFQDQIKIIICSKITCHEKDILVPRELGFHVVQGELEDGFGLKTSGSTLTTPLILQQEKGEDPEMLG